MYGVTDTTDYIDRGDETLPIFLSFIISLFVSFIHSYIYFFQLFFELIGCLGMSTQGVGRGRGSQGLPVM